MTDLLPDGMLLLAKQSGQTSFSTLWQVKRALGTKKIGHTGTLDSFADGLLVVLSGRLTRLASWIIDSDKTYEALIRFGSETDTLDPEGSIVSTAPFPLFETFKASLTHFIGTINQKPPAYSAIHINGQRSSDLARKGQAVEPASRNVRIDTLDLLDALTPDGTSSKDGHPVALARIRISCGKGTYVRSLARDIAYFSGSVAHLVALRRTALGPFKLEQAVGLEHLGRLEPWRATDNKPVGLTSQQIRAALHTYSPEFSVMTGLYPLVISDEQVHSFLKGVVPRSYWFTPEVHPHLPCTVFYRERLIGSVQYRQGRLRYLFVLKDAIE